MADQPVTTPGGADPEVLPSPGASVSERVDRSPALVVLDVTRPRRTKPLVRTIPGARDSTGATQRNLHARDELMNELDNVIDAMRRLGAPPHQRTRSRVICQIATNFLESYPDATAVAQALLDGWVE
jgi:hypothetical protein